MSTLESLPCRPGIAVGRFDTIPSRCECTTIIKQEIVWSVHGLARAVIGEISPFAEIPGAAIDI